MRKVVFEMDKLQTIAIRATGFVPFQRSDCFFDLIELLLDFLKQCGPA